MVSTGRIRVHIGDRTLVETGPGGVVGELAVLAPAPRSASVTALEPTLAAASPARAVRGVARRPSRNRAECHLDAGPVASVRLGRRSGVGRARDRGRSSATVAAGPRPRARGSGVRARSHDGVDHHPGQLDISRPTSDPSYLPVTYIGAAVAGVAASTALATALRRRPLASVAERVLAGLVDRARSLSCLVLRSGRADWVSFALLVLVPIVVPVGFMFVVGQAGMLLDVRSLKAFYARVVAGFALGFVVGGLLGPPLLRGSRAEPRTCWPRARSPPAASRRSSRRRAAGIRRNWR